MATATGGDGRFYCEPCGRYYRTAASWRRHQNTDKHKRNVTSTRAPAGGEAAAATALVPRSPRDVGVGQNPLMPTWQAAQYLRNMKYWLERHAPLSLVGALSRLRVDQLDLAVAAMALTRKREPVRHGYG